jgi:hypothetical protein
MAVLAHCFSYGPEKIDRKTASRPRREGAFGADVDYAQLVTLYGESPDAEKQYSPAVCIGTHKSPIEGNPDPKYISTSFECSILNRPPPRLAQTTQQRR